MASDSGADDAAALRERVAALEQTVSEQQQPSESPEQPTASRRGLLKGAAAVAGLGALGVYSSYPARAQAAGQVGTQSEPVDVEAWSLTVQNSATLGGDLDAGGNDLTNVGAVEADTVDITGSPNSGFPNAVNLDTPLISSLKDGYLVGLTPDDAFVTDPASFSSDAAALQDMNDKIVGSTHPTGRIYINPIKPDGTRWDFSSGVTFGASDKRAIVDLEMLSGGVAAGISPTLLTSINDGSTLFEWTGDTTNNQSMRGPRVINPRINAKGSNDVDLLKFTDVNNFQAIGGRLIGYEGDAFTIDGGSFGWTIDRINLDGSSASTAREVVLQDSTGNGPPGNATIGDGFVSDGVVAVGLHSSVACPGLRIGGHWESGSGRAVLDFPSLANATIMGAKIRSQNQTGTHGIYHDDGDLQVLGGEFRNVDDGIHCNPNSNVDRLHLNTALKFSAINSNAINIVNDVALRAVVPSNNATAQATSYPSGGSSNVYAIDLTQQ